MRPVPEHPEIRVLFVCTGNQCRSPMAAALLVDRLARSGIPAQVVSAGLVRGNVPAPAEVVEAAKPYGLDLSSHRSQQMTHELIAGADLVLGMAREHVREVVLAESGAWPKTFTLRELVRRGKDAGTRRDGQPLADWVTAVHAGRSHRDLLGHSDQDDVPDPMGGPSQGYKAMAVALASFIDDLMGLIWPPVTQALSPSFDPWP